MLVSTSRNRKLFYAVSLLACIGIGLETYASATRGSSDFSNPAIRAINLFVYFTIWCNILVGITFYLFAKHGDEHSDTLWGMYIAGLGGIGTIAIVNALYLFSPSTGVNLVSDVMIHIIVPVAALIIHILSGPRGKIRPKTLLVATLLPNIWIFFTVARGSITGWYPYSFIDPSVERPSTIIVNIFIIYALMYTLIASLWFLEHVLVRKYRRH